MSNCLGAMLNLGLALSSLPGVDGDGRRATLNAHGFADTQFNETQEAFINQALAHAKNRREQKPAERDDLLPAVLEIGGAYGDLGLRILEGEGYYIYNDMEPQHLDIATERMDGITNTSQFETILARFPLSSEDADSQYKIKSLQQSYRIMDIGIFSVAMYMSGSELKKFLHWVKRILPVGGKLYMTAVSPFINLFPGYEPEQLKRFQTFIESNGEKIPFPGWIPDVRDPAMAPYVPEGYLTKYPPYLHLLDHRVVSFHAEKMGFKIIESKFSRRLYPAKLIYQGNEPGVGEISHIILEKL